MTSSTSDLVTTLSRLDNLTPLLYQPQPNQDPDTILIKLDGIGPSLPLDKLMWGILFISKANNMYTLMYLVHKLNLDVKNFWSLINESDKLAFRDGLIQQLGARMDLPTMIQSQLSTLLCTITKRSYLAIPQFRQFLPLLTPFINSSLNHQCLALNLASDLVLNIQSRNGNSNDLLDRKVLSDFKDHGLQELMRLGITYLRKWCQDLAYQKPEERNPEDTMVLRATLNLLLGVASFDFIGTNPEESGEDTGSTQFPIGWKTHILNSGVIQNLFQVAMQGDPDLKPLALQTLVPYVSSRRSLWFEDELATFEQLCVNQMIPLLQVITTCEPSSIHPELMVQLARVLFRFRATYQLANFQETDEYNQFIMLCHQLTLFSLSRWEDFDNSIAYLLKLWVKLVSSSWNLTNLPPTSNSRLNTDMQERDLSLIPTQLLDAFLMARIGPPISLDLNINFVSRWVGDGPMDSLDDVLEPMASIARYKYDVAKDVLLVWFDRTASVYQAGHTQLLTLNDQNMKSDLIQRIHAIEVQLAWLVYLVGALLGGRVSYQSSDQDDLIDAELSSKVYLLAQLTGQFVYQGGKLLICEDSGNLCRSYLYFFTQFQTNYIGDSSYRASTVYQRLGQLASLPTTHKVLEVMVQTIYMILANLWTNHLNLIGCSIEVLTKLASGYATSKHLRELELIQHLLTKVKVDGSQFPFINNVKEVKLRKLLFSCLTKILITSDDVELFPNFLKRNLPVELLKDVILLDDSNLLSTDLISSFTGLCYDLCGIASSLNVRKSFVIFYKYLTGPDLSNTSHLYYLIQLSHRYLSLGLESKDLTTPLLPGKAGMKLISELSLNRSQRFNFPIQDALPLRHFKLLAPILTSIGQSLLNQINFNKLDLLILILLNYLRSLNRLLNGGYVCFGVFQVYSDPVLNDLLMVLNSLINNLPLQLIKSYPKLNLIYYELIEQYTTTQLISDPTLTQNQFNSYLNAIHQGLDPLSISTNQTVQIQSICCRSLDSIVTHILEGETKIKDQFLLRGNLPELIGTLLIATLVVKVNNLWSYSRPLYSLMVCDIKAFNLASDRLVSAQLEQIKLVLAQALYQLSDSIESDQIDPTKRDGFTQKLTQASKALTNYPIQVPEQMLENMFVGLSI